MAKIKPPNKSRKPVILSRGKKAPRITSSHRGVPTPSKLRKDPSPDEAQQEAVAEVNPAFVNPDGSVNFWATLNTDSAKDNSTDDEPTED